MFGHDKDDDTSGEPVADSTLGVNSDGLGSSTTSVSDDQGMPAFGNNDSSAQIVPPASITTAEPEEEEELLPAHASGSSADDVASPGAESTSSDNSADETPEPDNSTDSTDDLLGIKQKALTQLSPLVSHLDQNPEERFKTIMMMIQAADNQALIPDAYEAAQAIPDEKAKAQALLDIVNEINYFTQQQKS